MKQANIQLQQEGWEWLHLLDVEGSDSRGNQMVGESKAVEIRTQIERLYHVTSCFS